jgi:hypothetical protein
MVLSDRTIRRLLEEGRIGIDPYAEDLLQPSSVDVRVDSLFRVFNNARYPYIDVKREMEDLTELVEFAGDEPFILHPGEFVLGSTLERITLPDDLERRQPPDHDLLRDEDRPALVRPAHGAGGEPLRDRDAGLEVPGTGRPDAEPLLEELSGGA